MDASVSPFAFLLPIRLWDVSDEHRKLMLNAAVNSVLMVSHKALIHRREMPPDGHRFPPLNSETPTGRRHGSSADILLTDQGPLWLMVDR